MKRDTLGAIELGILLKKGIVEVFRDTDVIDSLHIAERVTKGDILLQKAVLNEYKSLQEHVFNGETIFLRFNDNIEKSQTDKDGKEGHWITTQDGNKAFIGDDGKLRFSAEQISAYVDEKESKESVKSIKIKIQKIEQVNDGVLYIFYRATNLDTKETKDSKSIAYYGSDIINLSSMTEKELMSLPTIHGKRYSKEKIVSEEIKKYSEDNGDKELKKEGWSDEIERAIAYVMY